MPLNCNICHVLFWSILPSYRIDSTCFVFSIIPVLLPFQLKGKWRATCGFRWVHSIFGTVRINVRRLPNRCLATASNHDVSSRCSHFPLCTTLGKGYAIMLRSLISLSSAPRCFPRRATLSRYLSTSPRRFSNDAESTNINHAQFLATASPSSDWKKTSNGGQKDPVGDELEGVEEGVGSFQNSIVQGKLVAN